MARVVDTKVTAPAVVYYSRGLGPVASDAEDLP